jgi:ubiquinol-cytochrome c reductase cytochrome c subunit
MSRRVLIAVASGALAWPSLAAAGPPPYGIVGSNAPARTPLTVLGYQLYAGNCSMCHGSNGEGILHPPRGQGSGGITGQGPRLEGVGAIAPDFYLRTGRMPFGQPGEEPLRSRVLFDDHQIRAMVAYIASLAPGPAIPTPHPERGNLSTGLHLFTQHCAGCHQVTAVGGYLKDAVAVPLFDATPTQVAEAVRVGPFVMPRFSKQQISDKQLDSIVRYVEYVKDPQDEGGWSIGRIGPFSEGLVTWLIAGVAIVAACVAIGRRLKA